MVAAVGAIPVLDRHRSRGCLGHDHVERRSHGWFTR